MKKQNRLTRVYEDKEILCKKCNTKSFRTVTGYPKEDYGVIVVHKKGCKYLKELLKNSIER